MRWRTEAFDRQTGSVPLQRSKSEQMWLIESSNQVNSPAADGARTCGNGVDCVQDTLLSRWASILSMTALTSIAAITLAVPPQTRHLATSFALNNSFDPIKTVVSVQNDLVKLQDFARAC